MRIDGKQSTSDTDPTSSSGRVATDGRTAAGTRTASGKTDRVDVSADAQLLSSALKAATAAPAVRQDRVDEVRQKLQSGELGQDAGRLADRLLDDLTGEK